MNTATQDDRIIKQIIINAPAQRVFAALTDPQQRTKWWGAKGKFEVTHMESDLRPGGAWLMRGMRMGNQSFVIRGEYREVQPPKILEFTWLPDWQEPQTIVRFDLEEKDGKTELRVTHSDFTAEFAAERYQGWQLLLGSVKAYVEKLG